MKVTGKGNEVTVHLEPGEIPSLLARHLECNARIHDYHDKYCSCPFSLSIDESNTTREEIIIRSEPENSYLPHAKRVVVYVGLIPYSKLLNNGLCGTRFGSDGKITLRDRTLED